MNSPERSVNIFEADLSKKTVADIKKEAFEQELKVTSVKLIYQGKLMLDSNKLSEYSK